jgi:predicted Fe-S protein YdhL (DUF1289 family)
MGAFNSPCIDVCTLDAATDTCLGCGRTLAEIERWTFFTHEERAAINAQLPARRARFEAARLAEAARIASRWPASECSRCGETFTCGATDCSTPCWCASYPPISPTDDARCMCPACLALYSSRAPTSRSKASE